jgi:hypothetical protein
MMQKGEIIIAKGELMTDAKLLVLQSYRKEYEERKGLSSNFHLILADVSCW